MAMARVTFLTRAVLIGAILTHGCTFQVPLQTRMPVRSGTEKSTTRVELIAPPSLADRNYETSGIFWIGIAHTWKFPIGREVVGSSQRIYQLFFRDVKVTSSPTKDQGSYLLVVAPEIQEFNVSSFSMGTEVVLTYQIRDLSDHLIYQSSVQGRSSFGGPQWLGVFLGVFVGRYALSDSASDALDEAYANLVRDLEDAVRRGALEPSAASADRPVPRHGPEVGP